MENNTFSRRQFINTITTASIGSAFSVSLAKEASIAAPVNNKGISLSVCVERIFNKVPVTEALQKVKDAGIDTFEFWGFQRKDIETISRKKDELGLSCGIFVWDTGGNIGDPATKGKIINAVKESIKVAKKLNCKNFLGVGGIIVEGMPRNEQFKNVVDAYKLAAPLLTDEGITVCIEPQNNLIENPANFLYSSTEVLKVVDEVNSPNIKLLFDAYHQQIMEGNLIYTFEKNMAKIGYIQIADVPGCHEPGTGEINFPNLFRAIAKTNYSGYLAFEFEPTGDHDIIIKNAVKMFREAIG